MTAWKKVRGSQEVKPEELDITTSASTVYQRKNIERIAIDNDDGSTTELWEYDERELTRDEFAELQIARSRADIDYIAMETGVDIDE